MAKLRDLASAGDAVVHDGDTVVMEGFTHLIPFAAGHESVRHRRRELTMILAPGIDGRTAADFHGRRI